MAHGCAPQRASWQQPQPQQTALILPPLGIGMIGLVNQAPSMYRRIRKYPGHVVATTDYSYELRPQPQPQPTATATGYSHRLQIQLQHVNVVILDQPPC